MTNVIGSVLWTDSLKFKRLLLDSHMVYCGPIVASLYESHDNLYQIYPGSLTVPNQDFVKNITHRQYLFLLAGLYNAYRSLNCDIHNTYSCKLELLLYIDIVVLFSCQALQGTTSGTTGQYEDVIETERYDLNTGK